MTWHLKTLIWLGVAVFLISFFGIPGTWKTFITALLGLGVVVVAVIARQHVRALSPEERGESKPYAENRSDGGTRLTVVSKDGE